MGRLKEEGKGTAKVYVLLWQPIYQWCNSWCVVSHSICELNGYRCSSEWIYVDESVWDQGWNQVGSICLSESNGSPSSRSCRSLAQTNKIGSIHKINCEYMHT